MVLFFLFTVCGPSRGGKRPRRRRRTRPRLASASLAHPLPAPRSRPAPPSREAQERNQAGAGAGAGRTRWARWARWAERRGRADVQRRELGGAVRPHDGWADATPSSARRACVQACMRALVPINAPCPPPGPRAPLPPAARTAPRASEGGSVRATASMHRLRRGHSLPSERERGAGGAPKLMLQQEVSVIVLLVCVS